MEIELFYRRVMHSLREKILNGEYKRGEYIPSEDRLCEQYAVSRTTVRTAVRELVDEGLLQIVRGKGTRVSFSMLHTVPDSMFSVFEEISRRGMEPELHGVEILEMKAPKHIAASLEIPIGEPLWRIFRVIHADGEPFSQNYSFVPAKRFGALSKEHLIAKLQQIHSFYRLIENEFGIRIVTVKDAVSAINGDENNIYLNQKKGDAVLRIVRVGYDAANTPIEYGESYIRGDRFTQHITIRRK